MKVRWWWRRRSPRAREYEVWKRSVGVPIKVEGAVDQNYSFLRDLEQAADPLFQLHRRVLKLERFVVWLAVVTYLSLLSVAWTVGHRCWQIEDDVKGLHEQYDGAFKAVKGSADAFNVASLKLGAEARRLERYADAVLPAIKGAP